MKKTVKSLRYALAGIIHAVVTERNLPLFLAVYGLELILGWYIMINRYEWMALIVSGGTFLSVELLNTAIERLSSGLNNERHRFTEKFDAGIRLTKDVAAAASFISLLVVIAVSLLIFLS